MLLKHKNGEYAKAYVADDGKIYRYFASENEAIALLMEGARQSYDSLKALEDARWSIVPPTFETLTEGDELTEKGKKYVILSAHGLGNRRVYTLGYVRKDGIMTACGPSTALELKAYGYVIASAPAKKPKAMTVAEVSKLVGEEVVIVEG